MLDYRLNSLKDVSAEKLVNATKTELHYDLFLGDIVFKVNGLDFSTNWEWVPVLDFAVVFAGLVKSLSESNDTVKFEFTESEAFIQLHLINDSIQVSASYVSNATEVPFNELLDLSQKFASKILSDLLEVFPLLEKNSYYLELLKTMKKGSSQ